MIKHNTAFKLDDDSYRYDSEAIQAYKNNLPISLKEFIVAYNQVKDLSLEDIKNECELNALESSLNT